MKDWLLRWTGHEWKEWERSEGMVYMWVSVETGESYVGSTKGTIIERARSHLRKVRKVRKEWEEKGGERRIEDPEVTEIHYRIAREPRKWVLIPVSGEVEDWKRVEKRLIRWFGSELNTVGKTKKKKKRRKRPLKKWREEKEKKEGEEGIKRGKRIAVSVYEIKGKRFEDLWNGVKNEGENVTVKWENGVVDVTRWEKLWAERELKGAEWKGKEIEEWREIRRVMRQKEKGEMKIEMRPIREENKWVRMIKVEMSEGWGRVGERSEKELWKMLINTKRIKEKRKRNVAKNFIVKEIKERTGVSVPRQVTVKIMANGKTDRNEVKKVAREMVGGVGVERVGIRYLQWRVRVVMTREENVRELLVNHGRALESFSEERPTCICGMKRRHVAKRGNEWECGRDEVMRVYSKVVPRPNRELAKMKVREGLSDLWRWVKRGKKSGWKGESMGEKVRRCVKKKEKEWGGVSLEDVRWVKKKMRKWVITWLDKNAGGLFVCCPVWYWGKVKGIFDWKEKEANYEKVEIQEGEIIKKWRKEMGWWGKEEKEGEVPKGYAVPKEKDTEKMRPIVSYAKHPWRVALNTTARIIAFLLKKVGVDETVVWKTMDVKGIVRELGEWVGEKEETSMMVGDIKNMYTELPQNEIVKAVEWLIEIVKKKVRSSEWVRVKKKGRGGGSFGRGEEKKGFVELRLRDVIRVVEFDLNNCYIRIGKVMLKQKWGVPMGSPLSPVLAVLICTKYERVFIESLRCDRNLKVKRYIDDVWCVGKYLSESATERQDTLSAMVDLKSFCYHPRMVLETEGVKEWADFLEARIERRGKEWRCEYRVKNVEREEGGLKKIKKFADYESYGEREKIGIVMGAMARVEQNCMDNLGRVKGCLGVVRDLHAAGYPNREIKRGLERMGRKEGGVWKKLKELVRS